MKDTRPVKSSASTTLKHKRRFCKTDGCKRIVKSQGVCQRHGAKPRKCKISTCPKQAQGNFEGMCKAHFRASKNNNECPSPRVLVSNNNNKRLPPPDTPVSTYCQPVLVHQDSVVSSEEHHHHRQGMMVPKVVSSSSIAEESTVDSTHAVTDEDTQGLELWDEPFFCINSSRNEELAADLFAGLLLPEQETTPSSGGHNKIKMTHHERILSFSSIPSCSDYTPTFYSNNYNGYANTVEARDASHSSSGGGGPYLDYYNHEYPQAREAV